MDRKIKAQVALEFFIFTALVIMIALAFLLYLSNTISFEKDTKKFETLKDITESVRSEINLAFVVEDGYRREFFIPEKIDSYEYEIMVVDEELRATIDDITYSTTVPNITGQVNKGDNVIIRQDGAVILN